LADDGRTQRATTSRTSQLRHDSASTRATSHTEIFLFRDIISATPASRPSRSTAPQRWPSRLHLDRALSGKPADTHPLGPALTWKPGQAYATFSTAHRRWPAQRRPLHRRPPRLRPVYVTANSPAIDRRLTSISRSPSTCHARSNPPREYRSSNFGSSIPRARRLLNASRSPATLSGWITTRFPCSIRFALLRNQPCVAPALPGVLQIDHQPTPSRHSALGKAKSGSTASRSAACGTSVRRRHSISRPLPQTGETMLSSSISRGARRKLQGLDHTGSTRQ